MPKRHASHALENRSKIAFRAALPSTWIASDPEDYGQDLVVEIVDGDRLTGLTFGVQLKATENRNNSKAMAIRNISLGHMEHWASLPYPLLVVRFIDHTSLMFVRWAHDHGFHENKVGREDKDPIFKMQPSEQLTTERLQQLPVDVKRFNAAQSNVSTISEMTSVSIDSASGLDIGEIETEFRSALNRNVRLVSRPPLPGELQVIISPGRFGISLGGWRSWNTWNSEAGSNLVGTAEIASDQILVGSIMCFDAATAAAAHYARAAMKRHVLLIETLPFCLQVAEIASLHGDSKLGEELARRILQNHPSLATLVAELSLSGDADETDFERLRQVSIEAVNASQGSEKGEALYNLGNLQRSMHHFDAALISYQDAVEADPRYHESHYWWSDCGGILFELWRFDESTEYYQQALQRCPDPSQGLITLSADAAMHNLQPELARELLDLLPDSGEHHPHLTLLDLAVDHLLSLTADNRNQAITSPSHWLETKAEWESLDLIVAAVASPSEPSWLLLAVTCVFVEPPSERAFEAIFAYANFHLGGELANMLGSIDDSLSLALELEPETVANLRRECRRLEEKQPAHGRGLLVRGLLGEGSEVYFSSINR